MQRRNSIRPLRGRSFVSAIKTIVMMDVVGSSAMWAARDDGEMMALLTRLNREVMHTLQARRDGMLIKMNGDAYMFCFDDVEEAVLFAADVQLRMVPAMGVHGLQMRVGVSEGIVYSKVLKIQEHEVQDFFGNTVNIAARIEAVTCQPGEVVVASSMRLQPLYDLLLRVHGARVGSVQFIEYKNMACHPSTTQRLPQVQGDLVHACTLPVDMLRGVPEFSCMRVMFNLHPPTPDANHHHAPQRVRSRRHVSESEFTELANQLGRISVSACDDNADNARCFSTELAFVAAM